MHQYPNTIINLNIILAIQGDIEAVKARIEAMKAENQQCLIDNHDPKYTYKEFDQASDELASFADQLRSL